jgi:hypothetical protein
MQEHKVVLSPDVYGLGTFVDVDVLPVPEDARRIFEILARKTPGFTKTGISGKLLNSKVMRKA